MEILVAILGLAALIWAFVFARHGSLLLAAVSVVVFGYVLTRDFWQGHLGPLPLTIDRLLLAGLVGLYAWRCRRGEMDLRALSLVDVTGALFVGYLSLRWMLTSAPPEAATSVSPSWRLIASFWMPGVVYFIASQSKIGYRQWIGILGCLTALGLYLAFTGIAEVKGQWWAVFPKFISNPALGTHFGRARGPALMSASLGIYLTICFWAAWFLWAEVGRWGRVVLSIGMLLMVCAIYYTYTRSCWLGLAAGLAVIPIMHFQRSWRPLLVISLVLTICLGGLLVGGKIVNMGRQDSNGSASHSVFQRASFLAVSLRMIHDDPLFGCGFGRFYDKKMPYLNDRSQQMELESIRALDHHNTYLSIFTETGLIGFVLFVALLAISLKLAWGLSSDLSRPLWMRCQGMFHLATLITYGLNALFHDLTLSPSEQLLLCLVTGVSAALVAPALRAPREMVVSDCLSLQV